VAVQHEETKRWGDNLFNYSRGLVDCPHYLARHSDINLTMSRYTHISLHDQAAALAALPSLSLTQTEERQGPRKLSG
jgi:hypothetical protein